MQSCGFYHNENTRMVTPYRHMNTFMGDPETIEAAIAEAAATTRKEAEKRCAEAGIDGKAIAQILGLVAEAEEAGKRRRCK